MKRKLAMAFIALVVLGWVGTSLMRSQGLTAPPAPPAPPIPPAYVMAPEPPEPPEPPAPPQSVFDLSGEGQAWLGVTLSDVTAGKARDLKLPGDYGAVVDSVEDNSPAAQAGLLKGDVILAFDGERVRSVAELRRLIRETPAGRTVRVEISRDGRTRTLSAKLESHNKMYFFSQTPDIHIPEMDLRGFNFMFHSGPTLGVSGDDLTAQLAQYFGVKQGKGVLVTEVVAGSAAEKAGLKAGDVIIRVGDKPVDSVSQLREALPRDFEGTKKVNLTIVRDRHEQTLTAELQAPERAFPIRSIDRKVIALAPEEQKRLSVELSREAAQLRTQVEQAMREWNQNKQEYMKEIEQTKQRYSEEMHRHMQAVTKELQQNKDLQKYQELLRSRLRSLHNELI
ncbi:MAG: PDZ domain-containing protein [Acidobacteriia bacterium]|nr:PDZ domain-containing protein [Terriglobia bacterium]